MTMDFLAISPARRGRFGRAGSSRILKTTRRVILGGVLGPMVPRTLEVQWHSREARPHLGGRRGRGVGGNDPGFGRTEPPKTHSARSCDCSLASGVVPAHALGING